MRLDMSYRFRTQDRVALFLLLAAVTLVGARLVPAGLHVAMWAPGTGIGMLALMAVARRSWPGLLALVGAATALGFALSGGPPAQALLTGALASLNVAATTALYQRFCRNQGRLERTGDVILLAACTSAASVLTNLMQLLVLRPASPSFLYLLFSAVVAQAIGTVTVAALFLVEDTSLERVHWLEVATQAVLLAALSLLAFSSLTWRPSPFLALLLLVWAGVRFGPRITTLEVLAVSTHTTVLSLTGDGPFAFFAERFEQPEASIHLVDRLHSYNVAVLFVLLTLTLTVNDTNRKAAALADSEDLLRQAIDDSMTGMVVIDMDGHGNDSIVQANAVAAEFFGRTTVTMVGDSLLRHLPQDRQAIVDVMMDPDGPQTHGWNGDMWALRNDRVKRLLSWTCSPLLDHGGGVRRLSIQFLDITDQHHARERLASLALHDGLTGLGNRMLLEDRLQYWLESNQRDQDRLLMVFLDLDDFKVINDGAGHEIGDQVLIEVARRLTAITRPKDVVARLGGDEFVVLVPQIPEPAEQFAEVLGSRLLSALSAPIELHGKEHRVGASVGMSLSRPTSTAAELMREADSAMYQAKREGKNCRAIFDPAHARAAIANPVLTELNLALDRGEFQLHVQPVIDLCTGRLTGGESLIRWRHPVHGILQPAAWLDVAENSDLVYGLGAWVIREACLIAARWQQVLGDAAPVMHANVSARQLGHGTLVADVRNALSMSGLRPDKLVLELTETQLERSETAVQEEIEALRSLGIQLAADDFGTGYSSLTRLTDMPIDILKIDRTFVGRMRHDERAGAVVAALVTMGAALGIEVVAEGVETVSDARYLLDLGCNRAQGYLWSRAVPPEQFLEFAKRSPAVAV